LVTEAEAVDPKSILIIKKRQHIIMQQRASQLQMSMPTSAVKEPITKYT